MAEEIWKEIPGFPDYEVSNLGQVRSYKRKNYPGYILRPAKPRKGYRNLGLMKNRDKYQVKVSYLVLLAFLGPRPPGLEVCHNNGDPHDDRLDNLRYDTHLANMQDAILHGSSSRMGSDRRLASDQVRAIRARYASRHQTTTELAEKYQVSTSVISHVLTGQGAYKGGPGSIKDIRRLDDCQVEAIRVRRAAGEGLATLAKEYGISESAISRIAAGDLYPGAPGPCTGRWGVIARERGASGVLGVHRDGRHRGRWIARIRRHGKMISIGRFDTVEDAAKAIKNRGGYYEREQPHQADTT